MKHEMIWGTDCGNLHEIAGRRVFLAKTFQEEFPGLEKENF